MLKLDILALGAHPDDVELSCSGTLIKHAQMGKKVGVVDLTSGQLGTRGNPVLRIQEAHEAAKIMKLAVRENLQMEDGFFKNDKEHQLKIIEVIRKYKPDVLLINAPEDRHPDHGRAAQLAKEAAFLSGLAKISSSFNGTAQEAWRPKTVYNYIQSMYLKPDFIVDISKVMEQKMQAILAYKSQFFDPNSKEENTFISSPEFLEFIKSRAKELGQIASCQYAEGFIAQRYLGIEDLTELF
ncbi:MAG: bacillithiol biosynthesis deacetylase BshB1 [Chitinophagales bacterium]|nr:bacillithiol biosynthesis deacetylase BshB1 [Chitinophagales bacterium]